MISVIGVGPGSGEYVTPAARKAIDEAEVMVAGERLLKDYAQDKESFAIKNNLGDMVQFIKGHSGRRVAVLASGDPGMYGILNYLLKHFPADDIGVIPGISSIQLACARLKISWHDAVITSAHGRDMGNIVDLAAKVDKLIILTDYKATPAVIASAIIDAGVRGKKAYVCQNLSYENEVVQELDLVSLKNSPGFPGSVLVIINE